MNKLDLEKFYSDKISLLNIDISSLSKKCTLISLARLLSALLLIALLIYNYIYLTMHFLIAASPLILFIFFVILGGRFKYRLNRKLALRTLLEAELACLSGKSCPFNEKPEGNGSSTEFLNNISSHPFAYDLDIFEKGSIFQALNRCSTFDGELYLSKMLLNSNRSKAEVRDLQEAVLELKDKRDFAHNISSLSINATKILKYKPSISALLNINNIEKYSPNLVLLIVSYLSIATTLVATILYILELIPSYIPLGLYIFQFVFTVFFNERMKQIYSHLQRSISATTLYKEIGDFIDKEAFQSKAMSEVKQNISKLSMAMAKLSKVTHAMDSRNNGLTLFVTNALFLRDILLLDRFAKWYKSNSTDLAIWLENISRLDFLISVSTYAFNNAHFSMPKISEDDNIILKAEALAHPSIESDKSVGNDILLTKSPKFLIITGANMAGKSTFIRSIGVNLLLASIGAPMAARNAEFSPTPLFTSMRTSDKLLSSSSYFHAELMRLSLLQESVKENGFTLILLDEILKGTNSIDKLNGSRMVLERFISLGLSGVVATHDLALADLSKNKPANYENFYFDFQIDDEGNMLFDYTLKKGVSTNMNATILLKRILE